MDEFTIIIEESSDEGIRIDKYLAATFPEKSRSYYQKAIDNGFVLVNGKQIKSKLLDQFSNYQLVISNYKNGSTTLEPFETARGIQGVKLKWNSSYSG